MRFLRTNTAVILTVGPFYDAADGVTLENSLTITNERITLTADTDAGSAPTLVLDNVTGATSATSNDLNYITSQDAGLMQLELSAANTNRLGRMFLSITDSTNHAPVFHEFMVLPAMIYDAFVLGTDVLDSSVTQILGTAVSSPATAGILDVNVKNIDNDAASASGTVTFPNGTVASTTNITAAAGIAVSSLGANVITAASTASDYLVEMENTVWNTNVSAHTGLGTTGANIDVPTSSVSGGTFTDADYGIIDRGTAQSVSSTTIQLRAAAAFSNDLINAATVLIASATLGTGQSRQITDYDAATDTATVDAWAVTPTGTVTYRVFATAPASATAVPDVNVINWKGSTAPAMTGDSFARLGAPAVTVSADIAAIKAVADSVDTKATNIQGRIPTSLVSGRIDASVGAIATDAITSGAVAASAVTELANGFLDATMSGHTSGGTVGGTLNSAAAAADPLAATVGGYGPGTYGALLDDMLDAAISTRASQSSITAAGVVEAAIKAKTDSLTFTKALELDVNIQSVNDTTVSGVGSAGSPWVPA